MLGHRLAESARSRFDVTATYRTAESKLPGVQWKRAEKMEALELIRDLKPSYVIDTAAFHNVDKCEEDPIEAFEINGIVTAMLATETAKVGGRYIYISTDFVFDGENGPYYEGDAAEPVNVYGESKLRGELEVLDISPDNQIVRPSVIYGWNNTRLNFATWLLSELQQRKKVSIVTDWFGSPTFVDSLASGILMLMQLNDSGVFHLAGPDCMSRYDFAVKLAREFVLDETLIQPVLASSLNLKAPRPGNPCLKNRRAKALGITSWGVDMGSFLMRDQRDIRDFIVPKRFKS